MAQNKLHLTNQSYIDADKHVPLALFDFDHNNEQKSLYQNPDSGTGRFFRLVQGLFNLFNHDEADNINIATKKDITRIKSKVEQHNDKQSLRDIENCANAARKAEAGGQYEWD